MKKYNFILKLILGGCLLSSCGKFIDEKPESFLSKETFYQNSTQMDEALNGVYSSLQDLYTANNNFWWLAEVQSDNTTFQFYLADRGRSELEKADYFDLYPADPLLSQVWGNCYSGINQANQLIDHLDNSGLEGDERSEVEGQARFIRALLYFNLVRFWGAVPLVTASVNSPNEAFNVKERAAVPEVYKFIIDDLKASVEKLPLTWSGSDVGRVSKGAANTLLGLVYLTSKDYANAADCFKAVRESGVYSLVGDYGSLYNSNNKYNSESIFEIGFNASVPNEQSNFCYNFLPLTSGTDLVGFNDLGKAQAGHNMPTRDLIRAYENGDKRKDASIGWYENPENTNWPDLAFHDSIPYAKKYAEKPVQPGKQNINLYIFRYGQVLLWEAETLNETNPSENTKFLDINMVRSRAGLEAINSGISQSEFRTKVFNEERIESAFENDRWFQLVRTDSAFSVMTRHGIEMKALQSYWLSSTFYDVQPYKMLMPVPETEKEMLNLDQNPGW